VLKILVLCFLFLNISAQEEVHETHETHADSTSYYSTNIWLKTYKNIKNYEYTLNKILMLEVKLEKAKKTRSSQDIIADITTKINLQKSKLSMFQKNNDFMILLKPYDFTINDITLYDYMFQTTKIKLSAKIKNFQNINYEFNVAQTFLNSELDTLLKDTTSQDKKRDKTIALLKVDIEYFNEFEEVLNKTYHNLMDVDAELQKKYTDYHDNNLKKHIGTLIFIFTITIVYLLILQVFVKYMEVNQKNSYKKVMALIITLIILAYLIMRYSENILYALTVVGVFAAALTIAMKDILLNFAGWIYIFFTNAINVGDRVLFMFETKHSVGDVKSYSLMKITLNEVENYSSVKEIKNSGRTIHIPNSYLFTKVFYNYTTKNKGFIKDLIEIDFSTANDFVHIKDATDAVFQHPDMKKKIPSYELSYSLNGTKTAITMSIWYMTDYKEQDKNKSELTINLIKAYNSDNQIILKSSSTKAKKESVEE